MVLYYIPSQKTLGKILQNFRPSLQKFLNFTNLYYSKTKILKQEEMGKGMQNRQQAPTHKWSHTERHIEYGRSQHPQ
uniref:Ovule protein n=1 Tax=Romanomermis culicivorax TaxID=13658 RepID=A0A915JCC8_ROMCU